MSHLISDARSALQEAVRTLALNEFIRTGIRWAPLATVGPETYEDLCISVKRAHETGYLPVWNVASDRSIYGQNGVCAFRYWHDMGHVEHGKSFTFEDELALQVEV
jgi:hypothetical protein